MSAALGRRPLLLGLVAVTLAAMPAGAQTPYPARPITLVVPFAAGGPTDTIARIVAAPMAKTLGQPIQVQNISGGGGTNGITQASQAPADGYTIMMGHMGTHGAAPALFRGLKYDPARTFDPIGVAAGTPIVLVARKDFPAPDLKGFVAAIDTEGAAIHQAQAGIGSVSHSAGVLFDTLAGARPTQVVYRGTGPAVAMAGDRAFEQAMDRAIDGVAVPRFYKGRQVAVIRRPDYRLALKVLDRHLAAPSPAADFHAALAKIGE